MWKYKLRKSFFIGEIPFSLSTCRRNKKVFAYPLNTFIQKENIFKLKTLTYLAYNFEKNFNYIFI